MTAIMPLPGRVGSSTLRLSVLTVVPQMLDQLSSPLTQRDNCTVKSVALALVPIHRDALIRDFRSSQSDEIGGVDHDAPLP